VEKKINLFLLVICLVAMAVIGLFLLTKLNAMEGLFLVAFAGSCAGASVFGYEILLKMKEAKND